MRNMQHDIGPELRLARPRTHHGFSSTNRGVPMVRVRTASASILRKRQQCEQTTPQANEYQIELLEYEWPDLPPIIHLKDAVCRKRVSQGINYLLPVDKAKNSIDSKFRTDLRAMFQEPYATEGTNYDETRIVKSAKIHFRTNVVDSRWTQKHIDNVPVNLNSESENIRKLYAHSAPAGGRSRMGESNGNLQTRSNLLLPMKARAHPEAQKLRKEVEDIIKSVQEENDETEELVATAASKHDKVDHIERKSIAGLRASEREDIAQIVKGNKEQTFETYEQLKNAKPPRPHIPDQFKSEYLSSDRNQEIWEWLHHGESITEFEYFLSVCG